MQADGADSGSVEFEADAVHLTDPYPRAGAVGPTARHVNGSDAHHVKSSELPMPDGAPLLRTGRCVTSRPRPFTISPPSIDQRRTFAMIRFDTTLGSFTIELFEKDAPDSAKNFTDYVDAGHFDGTVFHRVIPGFVVQGGGLTSDMKQKPTRAPIKNEAGNGLKNRRGTLSMARTNDPHSATSQFFINLVDNAFLDPGRGGAGYAVFGHVVDGMDVVDKMATMKTGGKAGHQDVPVTPIEVRSARQVTPDA
jgi:cyclophilin family peptidyl-prolyl cis-trans isomerase